MHNCDCFHTRAKCVIWIIIWIAHFDLRSVHTREVIVIFELCSVHTRDRIWEFAFQWEKNVWVPCQSNMHGAHISCASVYMQRAVYRVSHKKRNTGFSVPCNLKVLCLFTSSNKATSAEEINTKIIEFGWVILILWPFLKTQTFSYFAWFLRPMSEGFFHRSAASLESRASEKTDTFFSDLKIFG